MGWKETVLPGIYLIFNLFFYFISEIFRWLLYGPDKEGGRRGGNGGWRRRRAKRVYPPKKNSNIPVHYIASLYLLLRLVPKELLVLSGGEKLLMLFFYCHAASIITKSYSWLFFLLFQDPKIRFNSSPTYFLLNRITVYCVIFRVFKTIFPIESKRWKSSLRLEETWKIYPRRSRTKTC